MSDREDLRAAVSVTLLNAGETHTDLTAKISALFSQHLADNEYVPPFGDDWGGTASPRRICLEEWHCDTATSVHWR